MAAIELVKTTKKYGAVTGVDAVDLKIADGEFIVLLGPSGCGKSTLLRMVAGLEEISSGEIRFDGKVVNSVSTQKRNIAMVFQNYALYPHFSVSENLSFGLKIKGTAQSEIESKIANAAKILGISEYLARKPRQLSGGQRQRVAMGRSIVREPVAFLFDEPLSNLDAKLRGQMRLEIRLLQKKLNTTALYVTHDQVEAMTLADRVVVLNKGKIEQVASPLDLYSKPATLFVADFVGTYPMNFLDAITEHNALVIDEHSKLPTASMVSAGKSVRLGLRPEQLQIDPAGTIVMDVVTVEPLGSDTLVHGTIGKTPSMIRVEPNISVNGGDRLRLSVKDGGIHIFDPVAGTRVLAR
jgi:ABC-type sugar transport system ATPase subunit